MCGFGCNTPQDAVCLPNEDRYFGVWKHSKISPESFMGIIPIFWGESGGTGTGGGCNPPAVQIKRFE